MWKKTIPRTAGVMLGAAFLILGSVFLLQDRILFQARPLDPAEKAGIIAGFPGLQEVVVEAPDGTELHGWFLPAEGSGRQPLVIYYGGNASLAADILPYAGHFAGRALLVMDYRGYGLSGGKPREELLYDDALFIFDRFAERDDVDRERIYLMGFSLGTTVATHVAAKRPVEAVVLAAPFESVSAIVKQRLPFLAVDRLIRNPMEAAACAPDARAPLLALIAAEDRVVPNRRSRALVELWGGDSTLKVIHGRGHNDMHLDTLFWEEISRFLAN